MKSILRIARLFLIAICAGCTFAVFAAIAPFTGWQFDNSSTELSPHIVFRLQGLGKKALETNDVPVSAVLMYGDSVIGDGFNTVLRDNNGGGHAEINAISVAMRNVGQTSFSQLNRDSLVLISTFEPCTMCMGAILEYRIKHVRFLKPKPFLYLLREELRAIRYRWRLEQSGPESLQDSLFLSHPGYRPDGK